MTSLMATYLALLLSRGRLLVKENALAKAG